MGELRNPSNLIRFSSSQKFPRHPPHFFDSFPIIHTYDLMSVMIIGLLFYLMIVFMVFNLFRSPVPPFYDISTLNLISYQQAIEFYLYSTCIQLFWSSPGPLQGDLRFLFDHCLHTISTSIFYVDNSCAGDRGGGRVYREPEGPWGPEGIECREPEVPKGTGGDPKPYVEEERMTTVVGERVLLYLGNTLVFHHGGDGGTISYTPYDRGEQGSRDPI